MISITRTCPILFIHWAYYLPAYSNIKDRVAHWPPLPVIGNALVQRVPGDEFTPGKVLLPHVDNL